MHQDKMLIITASAFIFFFQLPGISLAADGIIQLQPYQRQILFTGFTSARQIIPVSSEVAGKCLNVFVDKADSISLSGQLAAIDPTFNN